MASDPKRVQAVFLEAVELPAADRIAVLDRACGADVELRQRVQVLLLAHEEPGSFLEQPAVDPRATGPEVPRPVESPGTRIGPYKLLEPIGEGGMGTVWMAEQQEPVRRLVALKVIKAGLDSAQVVARFEAERQALALMDHPHIAKVLDAGTTENGRPYFVMELVKGVPITKYCDERRLTPRQRLELFVPVCQAVQHAHQKGIIHRDLKPSNVLVAAYDGQPVPKVIDFGVAKATGQKLTERTLFTGFGHLVGTLEYMSPEQAEFNALDIDTRSDIYALGVLLYELLTGTTPLTKQRLKEAALAEVLRIIREEEPPKPSTRLNASKDSLASVSAQRHMEPAQLTKLVRGELDWIVMKALEKDRSRRYETANGLAQDVERYLRDEPVQAGPPSALYRFRKFARRNRRALTTAAAVVLAVAVSIGFIWRANQDLKQALEGERWIGYFNRIALAEREWSANNLSRAQELLTQCPEDLRGWEWYYLSRLLRGKALPPLRHDAAALCAAFSPDGQLLASSDQAGVVKIWDAWTGQELRRIPAHAKHARSVAFSPDGRYLASCSWEEPEATIRLWDVRSGQLVRELDRRPGNFSGVVFSPDGQRLAVGSGYRKEATRGGEVRVYDTGTGNHLFSSYGHRGDVYKVAFCPAGQRLASVSLADSQVKIWDAQTGEEVLTLHGHERSAWCAAFSPDGRLLASGSGTLGHWVPGDVKVWDTQTGYELLSLGGHVHGVISVAFSPDGRRLVTGGLDGLVKLWDVRTGQEALTLRGHPSHVRSAAFTADGHRLATAGDDGTVRVWDAIPWQPGETGQALLTLSGHTNSVHRVIFCPRGRRLASASADGTAKVWDLLACTELYTLRGHANQVNDVAFSPDGALLATGSEDHLVKLWDATTGKEVRTLTDHARNVQTVAFSPDGRRLAAAGYDFVVRIWDVETGASVQVLRGHTWVILHVAFSPDGKQLASAGYDHSLRLWDVATGEHARLEPQHQSGVMSVAFRPDGRRLALGSRDRTVRLWEPGADGQGWKLAHRLTDPTGGVNSVAFSPDGGRLAWGATDATVKVWEETTGEVHTLRGHLSWVRAVAWSPDGKFIASASQDGTIKIWEAPSAQRPAAAAPGR